MFKNYLKITIRNLSRYKGFSFINIFGLAIGMACTILILLWVQDELSFDQFHENLDSLYRVEKDQNYSDRVFHIYVTPFPAGPAFKSDIPQVIDATRVVIPERLLLRYKDKMFYEDKIPAVDPSILQMFSFPLLKGDINSALSNNHSLVITEKMAEKYFGTENPIGQVVTVNNKYDFTITGVLKNIPLNSSLLFDGLLPIEFLRETGHYGDRWTYNSILTFVQLAKGASAALVEQLMNQVERTHVDDSITDFKLLSLSRLHLYSYFGFGKSVGAIQYLYIFVGIALFVLLIACMNFMNLSTARAGKRAKEIGLRKVVGAERRHMMVQFLGESLFYAFIALFLALFLVGLLLGPFNNLSGKNISTNIFYNGFFLLGLLGITVLTGLIAGSYPAVFLSALNPVKVMKESIFSAAKKSRLRKTLVVTQFTLSIILMIVTGIVTHQLNFMRTKNLGFNKEQLLYIGLDDDTREQYPTFKKELVQNADILGVTATSQIPPQMSSNATNINWDGKDPDLNVVVGYNLVDFDYTETMKIQIKEGRTFSKDFFTDATEAFLINEALVKLMAMESPVGQQLSYLGRKGTIIGVMKDFHYQPVRNSIEPLGVMVELENVNFALIRLKPDNIVSSIETIKNTWAKINPNYPLEYHFLDEEFDRVYRTEERLGIILKYFSLIAILISCLGLFGLAAFMAEQRVKEIGVRKVLGASVASILLLLNKDFTKWVLFANIIAWPVSYLVMSRWLENFTYRITINWGTFILAGLLAFTLAWLTASYQAVRAATANPVDTIKYE